MVRSYIRQFVTRQLVGQVWRFMLVGATTAGVQQGLLWAFVEQIQLPYLFGAVIAIEITIIMTYVLNNAWTFQSRRNVGLVRFFTGLVKTNLVRGTAIPLQLAILFFLVEFQQVPVLIANGIAILFSGIYRFVLDFWWTWGRT